MHHPQEVALGASQPQQGKGKPSVTLHRGVLLGSIDTQGGGGSATRKMLPDRAGRYFTDRGGCIPLRRRGDKIRKTGSHWDNKGTFRGHRGDILVPLAIVRIGCWGTTRGQVRTSETSCF